MSESSAAPPVVRPRRRWRKWLLYTGLFLLVVAGLAYAARAYWQHVLDKKLQQAIADVDRQDPGWRLNELEAARDVLTDEENSALRVQSAAKLLPPSYPSLGSPLDEVLEKLDPQQQLGEHQIAALRAELETHRAALAEGRKLAGQPRGRYTVEWQPNVVETRMPHLIEARSVARLLSYDAMLRAQENDGAGAITSCRAILNAARSVGDEPSALSMLTHVACQWTCCQHLERALAQQGVKGSPAERRALERALADLQQLLEDEEKQPLLRTALRGERALYHSLLENLESGRVHVWELNDMSEKNPSLSNRVSDWIWRDRAKLDHAWLLETMTQFIALADLPGPQRSAAVQSLEAATRNELSRRPLAYLLLPAVSKLDQAFQRCQATSRCARVILAAERYRLAHGRLPDEPSDLVPAFLAEVPADPFDGQPLRWRRTGEGIVVYSVGPDGEDNQGTLDAEKPTRDGADLGLRLWDVPHRRQPPRPPVEPPPDEDK